VCTIIPFLEAIEITMELEFISIRFLWVFTIFLLIYRRISDRTCQCTIRRQFVPYISCLIKFKELTSSSAHFSSLFKSMHHEHSLSLDINSRWSNKLDPRLLQTFSPGSFRNIVVRMKLVARQCPEYQSNFQVCPLGSWSCYVTLQYISLECMAQGVHESLGFSTSIVLYSK
jgi:hypothetical protein